jgi:hypothetical protein
MEQLGSHGRIFMNSNIRLFFENVSRKFKFHLNLTRITGTLHEDQYTFWIISRSAVLRMRNFSEKSCREIPNTYFMFDSFYFSSKIVPFVRYVEKYYRAGLATDDYGACALCTGYLRLQTHTHTI